MLNLGVHSEQKENAEERKKTVSERGFESQDKLRKSMEGG